MLDAWSQLLLNMVILIEMIRPVYRWVIIVPLSCMRYVMSTIFF